MNESPVRVDKKPLAGRSAFVTGGARRLGRSIALALAEAGANVAITFRTSQAEAEETVERLRAMGVDAVAVAMDLDQPEGIPAAVRAVAERFGALDVVVNNAGRFESVSLDAVTAEQFDRMMAANARGPLLVAQAALPWLRRREGRVVNLGSLGGTHPWASHAHYCASKAALEMLTRSMAKAWAPEVSVNLVAPGWIEFAEQGYAAGDTAGDAAQRFASKTPMGRNGRAEEVAEAVMFFAAGPHFITGQSLAVDGGLGL